MDLSNWKTSDRLKVGGGVLFLIVGFLPWVKVEYGPLSESDGTVFSFLFTGTVPWLLIIGTAVVTVLLLLGKLPTKLPWPLITFAATALGALLLVLRLLAGPPGDLDRLAADVVELSRGVGMILSTLAGIMAAVGGFLGFKESGGTVADLTDVDKLKAAFGSSDGPGGDGGALPPPPPPPMPN